MFPKCFPAILMLATAVPSFAETMQPHSSIKAGDLPSPPVTPSDISDRPYIVLKPVTAGVRKATVFSKAASPEKVYRELWERAKKLGADAVIFAEFGESHLTFMSYGKTSATGIAIKFKNPSGDATVK